MMLEYVARVTIVVHSAEACVCVRWSSGLFRLVQPGDAWLSSSGMQEKAYLVRRRLVYTWLRRILVVNVECGALSGAGVIPELGNQIASIYLYSCGFWLCPAL